MDLSKTIDFAEEAKLGTLEASLQAIAVNFSRRIFACYLLSTPVFDLKLSLAVDVNLIRMMKGYQDAYGASILYRLLLILKKYYGFVAFSIEGITVLEPLDIATKSLDFESLAIFWDQKEMAFQIIDNYGERFDVHCLPHLLHSA